MARPTVTHGLHSLKKFLAERFSEFELRSIAARFEVAQAVPGPSVSIAQLADELVSTLHRQGALDADFFEVLRDERPKLGKELELISVELSPAKSSAPDASKKTSKKATSSKGPSKRRKLQECLRKFRAVLVSEGYYGDWSATVKPWADGWNHWMKENLSPTHFLEWLQATQEPKKSIFRKSVDALDEGYNRVESLLSGLAKVYD